MCAHLCVFICHRAKEKAFSLALWYMSMSLFNKISYIYIYLLIYI